MSTSLYASFFALVCTWSQLQRRRILFLELRAGTEAGGHGGGRQALYGRAGERTMDTTCASSVARAKTPLVGVRLMGTLLREQVHFYAGKRHTYLVRFDIQDGTRMDIVE